jgi:hypothetical protein
LIFEVLGKFPALHPCKAVISATSHNSGHTLRFALRWRSGAMLGLAARSKEDVFAPLRQIAFAYAQATSCCRDVICHCAKNGGVLPPLKTKNRNRRVSVE